MRKFWTAEEDQYMRENFSHTSTKDICEKLGRSYSSVSQRAVTLRITKTEAFLHSEKSGRLTSANCKERGWNGRFKKGKPSWNKGKKLGKEWTKGKMATTQFKKGHLPHNTKKDDDISIRRSKGRPYKWKRVGLGKWRELHRIVWEEHHGEIPEGYNVQFKDKNSLNCTIDNLYLIDRKNQMVDNSIHQYPPEIVGAIRVLSKAKKTIKNHEQKDTRFERHPV